MAYNGKYVSFNDFSGGYAGGLDNTTLAPNSAYTLDNIVLQENGRGFISRSSTHQGNSTEFGSADGYPVMGVGLLEKAAGTKYIVTVKNQKIYASSYGASRNFMTFADVTGAVTISTSGSATSDLLLRRFSFCTHNDTLIGFGGSYLSPNAPFKYTGSGNAAALGGTPPSAMFCLSAKNRVFAARTAAAPSSLYWSVLGNAEDWTGVGSGSAVIGSLADGEPISAICMISSDRMLVFKQSRIYQVDLTAAPFSSSLLFEGVGCAGNLGSPVVVDGVAYFITPKKRMVATDGSRIINFDGRASDLLNTFSADIYGFRVRTPNAQTMKPATDWIVWSEYNGTPANAIWDLNNKCWLKCSTGFKFVSGATDQGGTFIGGWYNQGKVFFPLWGNTNSNFPDDTGESSGAIAFNWTSGWLRLGSPDEILKINRLITRMNPLTNGSVTLSWYFDLDSFNAYGTATLSQTADSKLGQVMRRTMITGRGNYFMFKVSGNTDTYGPVRISEFTLGGKSTGQKVRTTS